jgi:thiol-disulfide isomerase/thioredoxin
VTKISDKSFRQFFFLIGIIALGCRSELHKGRNKENVQVIGNDTIILKGNFNQLSARNALYLRYMNEDDDEMHISYDLTLTKSFTDRIISKSPVVIRDDDKLGQINYILMPGDKNGLLENVSTHLLQFKNAGDQLRNKELDFFSALKINQASSDAFQMLNTIHLKFAPNAEFKEYYLNSIYKDFNFIADYTDKKYEYQKQFLNKYAQVNHIRTTIKQLFKSEIDFEYFWAKLHLILRMKRSNINLTSGLNRDLTVFASTFPIKTYLFLPVYKESLVLYAEIIAAEKNLQSPNVTLIKASFQGPVRDYLLYNTVKKAIINHQMDSVTLRQFYATCTNARYISEIHQFEQLNLQSSSNTLTELNGQILTFDELIHQNKGKTLFIDVWASWCVPCLKAMPFSKKIRDALQKKPIRFLHFSMDNSRTAWQEKVKDLNLPSGDCYIVSNNFKSAFAKSLKLSSIPRYIIIGKNGKILSANAIAPDDKSIVKYLTEIINK